MTKKEMTKSIAQEMGLLQAQAQKIVQRVFGGIIETLVDEGRMELRNFGVFEVKQRKSRPARSLSSSLTMLDPVPATIWWRITTRESVQEFLRGPEKPAGPQGDSDDGVVFPPEKESWRGGRAVDPKPCARSQGQQ